MSVVVVVGKGGVLVVVVVGGGVSVVVVVGGGGVLVVVVVGGGGVLGRIKGTILLSPSSGLMTGTPSGTPEGASSGGAIGPTSTKLVGSKKGANSPLGSPDPFCCSEVNGHPVGCGILSRTVAVKD